MNASTTLKALRRAGYTVAVVDGRLKLRGPEKPPEKWEARILQHRDEMKRLIEEGIILDEREVFALADEFFGNSNGDQKEGAA